MANPGFEDGLASWTTGHTWYVGEGRGLSEVTADTASARSGNASLRITGDGNRGIAVQAIGAFQDTYRVSGWLRCEGLGDAQATILIEWIAEDGTHLGAEAAGSVTGTAGWTHVEKLIDSPPNAVTMLVDLLTSSPNSGTAWFDDIAVEDTTTDTVPPAPVVFRVSSPAGEEGAVLVDWSSHEPERDIAWYEVYVADTAFASVTGLVPARRERHVARSSIVRGLANDRPYFAAVVAVDQDGNRAAEVRPQEVVPLDAKPPRPISPVLTPLVSATPSLLVEWEPSPLDAEIAAYRVLWREPGSASVNAPEPPLSDLQCVLRHLPPSAPIEVAVTASDATGNTSEPIWCPAVSPAATGPPGLTARSQDGSPVAARFLACPLSQAGPLLDATGVLAPGLYRLWAEADGYVASPPVLADVTGEPLGHEFALRPAQASSTRVWAVHPLVKVFRDDTPPADAGAVDLLCAANESESGQIVVRSDEPLEALTVWCTHLSRDDGGALIRASSVASNFVGYVRVEENSRATPPEELLRTAPADFPDVLLDDRTIEVAAGECQPIFVRVDVPRDAAPGVYTGTIYVCTATESVGIPIRLQVLPFVFPDRTRLLVTNWFSTAAIAEKHGLTEWSPDFWRMLDVYARTMAAHHQNIALVSLGLIAVYEEDDRSYTFDFTQFDQWVELFDAAGLDARIELGHLGGRKTADWECPEFIFGERPATRRRDGARTSVPVATFVAALESHLRDRGWLERAMQHIADEPIPVNVDSWRAMSRAVRAAAPDLRRIDAIHVTDLDGDLEVWVPQLNYYADAYDTLKQKHEQGIAEVWFYIAWVPQEKYPNRLIDTETIKTRIIHWMNYYYGAPGYLHWGLNWWNIPFGHFSPGDEWIIWPGSRGPLSSLRYEAQREGIEDYEYLAMLEDARRAAGHADPAAASRDYAARLVRSFRDYEKNPEAFETVRRELARELARELSDQ